MGGNAWSWLVEPVSYHSSLNLWVSEQTDHLMSWVVKKRNSYNYIVDLFEHHYCVIPEQSTLIWPIKNSMYFLIPVPLFCSSYLHTGLHLSTVAFCCFMYTLLSLLLSQPYSSCIRSSRWRCLRVRSSLSLCSSNQPARQLMARSARRSAPTDVPHFLWRPGTDCAVTTLFQTSSIRGIPTTPLSIPTHGTISIIMHRHMQRQHGQLL